MSPHVLEELPDLVLGALDAPRRASVEAHLDGCPDCAGAFADLREIWGLLAHALPDDAPAPALRDRVLHDATGRLARFATAVSALLGIDDAAARAALDSLDDPGAWMDSPMPGTRAVYVSAEPTRLSGFIRVPSGGEVPRHEHLGRELTLVLQGGLLDDSGRLWHPGEVMTMEAGSRHTFCAFGPLDCICAVLIEGGYSLAA